jgi:hypothetical protein
MTPSLRPHVLHLQKPYHPTRYRLNKTEMNYHVHRSKGLEHHCIPSTTELDVAFSIQTYSLEAVLPFCSHDVRTGAMFLLRIHLSVSTSTAHTGTTLHPCVSTFTENALPWTRLPVFTCIFLHGYTRYSPVSSSFDYTLSCTHLYPPSDFSLPCTHCILLH